MRLASRAAFERINFEITSREMDWIKMSVAADIDPAYSRITVMPYAGALGAIVSAIDLAAPLDDATIAELRRAFLEYSVIFFEDQPLTDTQLVRFGQCFGTLAAIPPHRRLPDADPHVLVVEKKPEDHLNFGSEWHSDTTYLEQPTLGSILLAKQVPDIGGDTLFANQYLAYEALSSGLKAALSGLRAVHTDGRTKRKLDLGYVPKGDSMAEDSRYKTAETCHPVVRTHPETGRKALFINMIQTERFEAMTIEESRPLLQYLYAHSTRPEFTCRFRWQPGSIAFWDNRCLQHWALNDYPGKYRRMHRIQIKGDTPI
jgi:taurine dioxygenase